MYDVSKDFEMKQEEAAAKAKELTDLLGSGTRDLDDYRKRDEFINNVCEASALLGVEGEGTFATLF